MTPAWMKEQDKKTLRRIINNELEDEIPLPKFLKKIPLWFGTTRSNKKDIFNFERQVEPTIIAYMKCFFLEEKEGVNIEEKMEHI